jgi:hypothetical protein
VTWNVQGRCPDAIVKKLKTLLKSDGLGDEFAEKEKGREKHDGGRGRRASGSRPDVYAIALQEIPIAPQYVLMDSLFDDAWSDTLG